MCVGGGSSELIVSEERFLAWFELVVVASLCVGGWVGG